MRESLTVVLPVHNAEAALESNLRRVLDLAGDLTHEFGVLVVDDGSTDDTFDVARELAARYPQIRVMRNPVRRGLGPIISRLHARLRSEVVIVHDGTSNVDVEEIRTMWLDRQRRVDAGRPSLRDLRAASVAHASMQRAHQRVAGFQLLSSLIDTSTMTDHMADQMARVPKPRMAAPAAGVGVIPPLPKSSLFGSLSEFALGE